MKLHSIWEMAPTTGCFTMRAILNHNNMHYSQLHCSVTRQYRVAQIVQRFGAVLLVLQWSILERHQAWRYLTEVRLWLMHTTTAHDMRLHGV